MIIIEPRRRITPCKEKDGSPVGLVDSSRIKKKRRKKADLRSVGAIISWLPWLHKDKGVT